MYVPYPFGGKHMSIVFCQSRCLIQWKIFSSLRPFNILLDAPKQQTPHLLGRHGVSLHSLFLNHQFPLIPFHLNASADDAWGGDGANDPGGGDGADGDDHRSRDHRSTTGQGQRKRQGGAPGKGKVA